MFASLVAVFVAAAAIQAAPTERALPNCKTVFTGYLSTTNNGTSHSFGIGSNKDVVYTGDGKNPLKVEFQACLPPDQTIGTGGGNGEYAGRLFVPSVKQCVSITNQQATAPPYFPVVGQCLESGSANLPVPAQAWLYRTAENNAIYWSGSTDAEGTQPQGGCGLFGYKSHSKGVPTTTANKQVQLACYGASTPFRLSDKAN